MENKEKGGQAANSEMHGKDTENSVNNDTKITPDAIKKEFEKTDEEQEAGFFRIRSANKCIDDAKNQSQPRDLYKNLIFEGEITLLFADTGVGKSILSVQIAHKISETDKVLYLDLELSDKQFQKRYSENYQNDFVFSDNFIRIDFKRPFQIPKGANYDDYFIQSIKKAIKKTDAKIVIIDNMTKLISSDTDKASTAKPLMDLLSNLKFEYNLTLLLLEHTRKIDLSRPISLNDLQGSKHKPNFADAVFAIGKSAVEKNIRYIKQLKCRSSEIIYDSDNIAVCEIIKENSFLKLKFISFDTEYNHLKEPSENAKKELIERVKELSNKGMKQREIAAELKIALGTVSNYLKK